MNIYLVDFENVNSQGLNGINRLDGGDRIIIFYSENADSMTFDLHEQINQSRAKIDFQKVDVGTKNALDFQLATYLGYLVCENEKEGVAADYFVVTKDRGYSSLVTYWTKRNVDITLVGSLIQSMRIQKERSDEKRRAQEIAARAAEPTGSAAAEAADPARLPDGAEAVQAAVDLAGEETFAGSMEPAPSGGGTPAGSMESAPSEDEAPAGSAESAPSEDEAPAGEAAADLAGTEMTQAQTQAEAENESESGGAPEEEKPKRTRSRRRTRTTAEQTADRELRVRVEQAVPDKDVVDLVVSYIKKYKTKLGINNALAKEFKDSKKASEIYKSIKPLIADKKGQ